MHVTDLHRRSVEGFMARVDAVGAEAWAGPTPCPDWDVRALVNHVVNEDLWTVPLMEGATIEEVGSRFDGDLLGDDPAAATRAACETASMATASGIVAGRTVHLSFGDTPAEEYAYQLAADHVIHGWDLAAATGGDRSIDTDVAEALAAWFADREELYRGAGAIGPRPDGAAATAAGAGDDPVARLLMAFGRDPGWAPPAGG
ncbi:MAG TPA: TIGR03086 family metal-binding protein [Acidimicrobiales bacterium]|nr:TIGR03086 family metal-binding protein [Acidimicrobiales bacterium]